MKVMMVSGSGESAKNSEISGGESDVVVGDVA